MKVILLTFVITDATEARTKRLTVISSEKFFEGDVNRLNAKLREGQQIIALATYSFTANIPDVNALWKELRMDTTISWRDKVDRLKQEYPDGIENYMKV